MGGEHSGVSVVSKNTIDNFQRIILANNTVDRVCACVKAGIVTISGIATNDVRLPIDLRPAAVFLEIIEAACALDCIECVNAVHHMMCDVSFKQC